MFEHDLLVDPIVVESGTATVPDAPGLGHEVDMDAVERFGCQKPQERPNPPRLIESNWPGGQTIYLAEGAVNFVLESAMEERKPYFEQGVKTRLVPDDGIDRWQDLRDRATEEPIVEDDPVI